MKFNFINIIKFIKIEFKENFKMNLNSIFLSYFIEIVYNTLLECNFQHFNC